MDFLVLDSFEPISPEWDELATRIGAPPFLRPGWFEAWWRSFGRGRLEIATVRRNGELVGVSPLARHFRTVIAVANVHSPVFALLAADEAVERALADRLFNRRPLHT